MKAKVFSPGKGYLPVTESEWVIADQADRYLAAASRVYEDRLLDLAIKHATGRNNKCKATGLTAIEQEDVEFAVRQYVHLLRKGKSECE